MPEPKEPQQVIHTRLPKRLVDKLGHYAINHGHRTRQDALAEILEAVEVKAE